MRDKWMRGFKINFAKRGNVRLILLSSATM